MAFPLPPIDDLALQKFCETHNLYEAVAAGYHYAQKFFPAAKLNSIHLIVMISQRRQRLHS